MGLEPTTFSIGKEVGVRPLAHRLVATMRRGADSMCVAPRRRYATFPGDYGEFGQRITSAAQTLVGSSSWAYNDPMQSPMLVFDHVRKIAQAVPTAPARKQLAELARSERNVATSGRPSK